MLQLSLDDFRQLLQLCHGRGMLFGLDRTFRRWNGSLLGRFAGLTGGAKMFPDPIGKFVVKGAGMRFSLDPDFSKILQDNLALDFQLARQNIDSYIAHTVLVTLPCSQPVTPAGNNPQA
jgi:hypothetical protein